MGDVAIRVENLGKRYRIGDHKPGDRTLRETLTDVFRVASRRTFSSTDRRSHNGNPRIRGDNHFWALKGVSFEVEPGEVLGIIGRNGAGKSTLLKILSRITKPTKGSAEIRGRVGSLLEVGTGFHPELTGRENIYLSGAILGMSKAELDRAFDEIVEFSGVEGYIDTPVKRFSSGMQVRLGFAVAAHLEPDILLVDEVLAVGDAAFQTKCLRRMHDVAMKGRTVVFVSHSMAAVTNLCGRALLLDRGRLERAGHPQDVAEAYVRSVQSLDRRQIGQIEDREGNGHIRFTELRVRDTQRNIIETVHCGQNVTFELSYSAERRIEKGSVVMSIAFFSLLGQMLFLCRSDVQGTPYEGIPDEGIVSCTIPKLPLPPGEFRINLQCEVNGLVADWIRDAKILSVVESDFYGSGRLPPKSRGDLLIEHYWLPASEG